MRVSGAGILASSSVLEIAATILILVLLILILISCCFKPWRRYFSPLAPTSAKVDDIERPLISEDPVLSESLNWESASGNTTGRSSLQGENHLGLPQSILDESKQATGQPVSSISGHSSSLVLHSANTFDDSSVGLTLKHATEAQLRKTGEDLHGTGRGLFNDLVPTNDSNLRSTLLLEVVSGPSCGSQYSFQSKNSSKLQVSIGRVSPGDVILKDSEVSGKHAMINWNVNKLKWELIDMGSLNGTILNSVAVQLPQYKNRCWSDPVELSNGDTITLGTSSKISVHITFQTIQNFPFGIGKASDSMALRRGGKSCPWKMSALTGGPFPDLIRIMLEAIAGILSNTFRREKVLSYCDASDVLREAFYETEAKINHYYEGCTATVVLVWIDDEANFFLQCANVGDSACVVSTGGILIKMTEDHRISSHSERLRIEALGSPLRDGETRICGMNLARMLGDKFLKEQDVRFSSEPYISEVAQMNSSRDGFALLASDGFWDVVNVKRAVQLVHQALNKNRAEGENCADNVANVLLTEARTLRTKDNTSIIFLDFTHRERRKPLSVKLPKR